MESSFYFFLLSLLSIPSAYFLKNWLRNKLLTNNLPSSINLPSSFDYGDYTRIHHSSNDSLDNYDDGGIITNDNFGGDTDFGGIDIDFGGGNF